MYANVLRLYLDARYWADLPGGRVDLIVGAAPGGFEPGAGCALVTAYNPGSVPRAAADNEAGHARLGRRLEGIAGRVVPGAGASPDGTWIEPSWFALDLLPADACALAREFGQNAILAARGAGPLLLHVLDHRLEAPPGMDTRFVRWVASAADPTPDD